MELWRSFHSRSKTKTAILTLFCLSAILVLLETWRSDSWALFEDESDGLTSTPEAGLAPVASFTGDGSNMPSVTLSEDTQDGHVDESSPMASSTEPIISTDLDAQHDGEHSDATANSTIIPEPVLNNRPAIVAALMKPDDGAWMPEFELTHETFPYVVTAKNPDPRVAVPKNKGREAMAYLTYLIDNYDNLPPYAIFIHGHLTAWHQHKDMRRMIRDLQVPALEEAGYISFRCDWNPSCPAELRPVDHDAVQWGDGTHVKETEDAIANAWADLFPDIEIPRTLASPCCAQFAVTRKAMMTRTKEDYTRLRNWILSTKLNDTISGRVMEKLWAFMMTNEPVHCPAPATCACKYFGSCRPRSWAQPPKALGPLPIE